MTTIAVNRRSIACDRQAVYADDQKFLFNEKIFKLKPTQTARLVGEKCWSFVGFAGDLPTGVTTRNWMYSPDQYKFPKQKDMDYLMLTSTGNIYHTNDFVMWELLQDDYSAIGTGRGFAFGALAMGCTPKKAVLIAQQSDLRSGMGVLEYRFRPKKKV